MMEKNAVLGTNNNNTKTASLNTSCPACGRSLSYEGSLPKCPVHGTAPFEMGSKMSHTTRDPFRK